MDCWNGPKKLIFLFPFNGCKKTAINVFLSLTGNLKKIGNEIPTLVRMMVKVRFMSFLAYTL